MTRLTWRHLRVAGVLVLMATGRTTAGGQTGEAPAQVVTVRAGDGLIEVRGHDGVVTRAFGASAERLSVRVSTGDLLRTGSPLVLTAVKDRLEPCRLAWDPDTGQPLELSWSNGGFFALDVAGSAGEAISALERRNESGRPEGSIMECTDPRSGTVLFHSEWFHQVTAVATDELLATSPGPEIVTADRAGNIQIWQHGRLGGGIPAILRQIAADGVEHLDVAVGQVLEGEGPVVVACDRGGRILIYRPADGVLLATLSAPEPVARVACGTVGPGGSAAIVAVGTTRGDVLVLDGEGTLHRRIQADAAHPFVDVATIGASQPMDLTKRQYDMDFGPVDEVKSGTPANPPWRVKELTFANGGEGLIRPYACLFTIANYRPYGFFSDPARCELPGKLFRARASGAPGDQHQFVAPAFWGAVNRYRMVDGRLHYAWRVKAPQARVEGGRFAYVRPADGPWEIWCNRAENQAVVWTLNLLQDGAWATRDLPAEPDADGWLDVQLVAEPRHLSVQLDRRDRGQFAHDRYGEPFYVQFGSAQAQPGGAEVVSEFRHVYLDVLPYPYPGLTYAEGPEDIRPQDDAIAGYVRAATPEAPRISEGDLIQLKDGSILAVYSYYHAGKGWDGSPAYLAASTSADGGRTWSDPRQMLGMEEGSADNVMSVSLLRGQNGDILIAYIDQTPAMKAKGMVFRRSSDEGLTWSPRLAISPDNGNLHYANNACLVRLGSGRIVLAVREYIGGIRWPYALYSDDDGRTWQAGQHVPDPDLTPEQKRGQNVNEPSICELADGRLLMTMRSIAGGQFFSWSGDQGATWTKPVLSPLRGACSPAILRRLPGRDDVLALFTYHYGGRTRLLSAISDDGGLTWRHLKRVEQSEYHGYCYASCLFVGDRVLLSYMHVPAYEALFRFEAEPGYIDCRFVSLPLAWFYRDVDAP